MTGEETGRFLALLAEGWRDAPDVSSAAFSLWQRTLTDVPYPLAEAAFEEALLVGAPFCPKPSEIRRRIVRLLHPDEEIPQAAQAWQMVRESIWKFWDDPDQGLASLPTPAPRVAKSIGWHALNNEESAVLRAHFLKMYEVERQRAIEEAALPASFKERRAAMRLQYAAGKGAGQAVLEEGGFLNSLSCNIAEKLSMT
ncbi:MAG: hypothetical protein WCP58_09245 [bacterium]